MCYTDKLLLSKRSSTMQCSRNHRIFVEATNVPPWKTTLFPCNASSVHVVQPMHMNKQLYSNKATQHRLGRNGWWLSRHREVEDARPQWLGRLYGAMREWRGCIDIMYFPRYVSVNRRKGMIGIQQRQHKCNVTYPSAHIHMLTICIVRSKASSLWYWQSSARSCTSADNYVLTQAQGDRLEKAFIFFRCFWSEPSFILEHSMDVLPRA